ASPHYRPRQIRFLLKPLPPGGGEGEGIGLGGRGGGSSCCVAAAGCRQRGIWRVRMRRVMYIFLPDWPIDRLRRSGSVSALSFAAPAEEAAFATVLTVGGRRLLAAVNPAAAAAGLAPGLPLAQSLAVLPGPPAR